MAVERQAAVAESSQGGTRRTRERGRAERRKVQRSLRSAVSESLEGAAGVVLAAVLVCAPLPYGSNRPWSWSLLAAAIGLALVLAGAAWVAGAGRRRLPWILWPAFVATAAVWIWAWVQTLPVASLPTWGAWAEPHWFWREAEPYGVGTLPLVGLGAEAGRTALMRLIAYGGAFWAGVMLLRERERPRLLLVGFVGVATAYAVYGIVNHLIGWETVLWEDETKSNAGWVTSTFINRNSFATYANMAALAGIGLLVEPFLKARGADDVRRIARETMEKLLEKRGALLVAIVLLVSAMLLSGSRGGFLSAIVAVLFMLLLAFAVTRPRPLVLLAAVAGILVAGAAVVWVAGEGMLQRLSEIEGTGEGRTMIWQDTLAMIGARPELGHGYGTYPHTFPLYQDLSAQPLGVDLAHDTYLEHAAELGVPATLVLYTAPVLLFLYCVRGTFVRRREQVFPLVAASVTVLVAVHALVDFSLQIPAVAVTYAVILGMGVAQSLPSPRPTHGASLRD